MSLQNKLYKEILAKKKEIEQIRMNGGNARIERDLPCMAVACEYAGVEKCGFSSRSKHITRPDVHYPFDPLLQNALIPNRSLAPACLFKIKVLCCPPKSKKSLPLIHGSHKT